MAHRIWSEHKATSDELATLSSRESQVLACVLEGMSNKETARILGVSPKAIELYRGHLMQKMNADNVVKLVLRVSSCVSRGGGVPTRPPASVQRSWMTSRTRRRRRNLSFVNVRAGPQAHRQDARSFSHERDVAPSISIRNAF